MHVRQAKPESSLLRQKFKDTKVRRSHLLDILASVAVLRNVLSSSPSTFMIRKAFLHGDWGLEAVIPLV